MAWKEFLIRNQILLSLLVLSCTSCGHAPIPVWTGKIWAGDSLDAGIRRSQDKQFIAANSKYFDQYMAMTYVDFKSFYKTYVLGCKDWGIAAPMEPLEVALRRFVGIK